MIKSTGTVLIKTPVAAVVPAVRPPTQLERDIRTILKSKLRPAFLSTVRDFKAVAKRLKPAK